MVKDTAITFQRCCKELLSAQYASKSLELKHTIKLIQELDTEIAEIEDEINNHHG